jgi:uncharacterized protein
VAETAQLTLSPYDLTVFLACEHATALELAGTPRPERSNPQLDLIRRKGEEHELAHLEALRSDGKEVREITFDHDWDAAAAATIEALEDGVDVVYQGVFVDGRWRGIADFLIRQPDGTYQALDTKLAKHAKPAYILQLLFYNEQLARLQGREPERIHVLLGSGEQASFRPEEFGAYFRRVRSRLAGFLADPPPTEPWPCDHCRVCDFKPLCDTRWDEVDHLSRVAGISRRQIDKLLVANIATLAALGRAPVEPPSGISPESYTRIREQAELQLRARDHGRDEYRLLPLQPDAGFALLPEPSPGDLFFDFEGNPFWDRDGSLEYLWGILDADRRFTPIHARDRKSERRAFEQFVDLVHARLREHPNMHVYHYARYEITALERLAGFHGTREHDLDDLLRRGVFVDLLRVVRNGLRASRPGYGLKELETFLDFERRAEIRDGGASIVAFEAWMATGEQALLDEIDAYNEEDCIATLLLRDWLLELRDEVVARYGPIPAPEPAEPRETPPHELERSALQLELLDAGEEVAAHLLDYHDRERKPVWWAIFDRLEKTHGELIDDAESVGGLVPVGEPGQVTRKSRTYTFTFPPQEHNVGEGQDTLDPATRRSPGRIVDLDRKERRIVLERGPSLDGVELPAALIPGRPYDTPAQDDALARFGRSLLAGDHRYPALESILRREPFGREIQTTDLDEMKALLRSLDRRHLLIQGPPGSGKTWTCGRLIADLIAAGKTVGAASTSHQAIHKLLEEVETAADELGIELAGRKKASAGNPESYYRGSDRIVNVEDSDDCAVAELTAGTAWHFAREPHDGSLDYLFVDEAGQVSLADALAMGTAARNVVLVGDPQQLAQVLQGTHPAGTEASVLNWLLGDAPTIPPDRGLFLERTFRLHPDVCDYISAEFYEGRLRADPRTSARTTPLGTGLRFVPVVHDGCRQESEQEVAAVRGIVDELLVAGVPPGEVLVVAPYNMQVDALAAALPEVRVGTVDKFQGQEADVVVYSMASSSAEDVPRGLRFLLSRNRLNVAVSRARCLAYLVASPRLLEVNCRTIDDMRLANALCRFVELAR